MSAPGAPQPTTASSVTPKGPRLAAADLSDRLGAGQPLDPAVRGFAERHFGFDFARVRVHADERAADLASQLGARAFTFGRSIAFGPREYRPSSTDGRRLIAHELAHVVQQSGAASAGFVQRQPVKKPEGPTREELEALDKGLPPKVKTPAIKDIIREDQTVPIKGLPQNQTNYVDHVVKRMESAPFNPYITFFAQADAATGVVIPKGDFYLDSDPLAGQALGHARVYKSRAVAEAVAQDLMKYQPDVPVYTYYLEGGIIFPTTLSATTIPNLLPYILQQRESDREEFKAGADLAKALALWYVGARFPIKIRSGAPTAKETLKQLEKEATKQTEKEAAKQASKQAEKEAAKQQAKKEAAKQGERTTARGVPKRTPDVQPSAPAAWKGTLNDFGKEIGWPTGGKANVPAASADLAKLRSAGVTETWAAEQAQIYREVLRLNPANPTAKMRAEWLEAIAARLRGG
jgi:hypothetical protein